MTTLESSTPTGPSSVASHANFTETTDAVAGTGTGYTMAVGDTFTGTLSAVGDQDWVRILLTAGQTYTFTLDGSGGTPVGDTYLELLNASGTILVQDDDGGATGLNSAITFTATASGTYYLNARSYNNSYTGGYTLTTAVAPPPTVFTHDQIADQLTHGYWESSGRNWRAFDIDAGQALTVNITGLTAAGQQLANWAFSAWTAATGIRFTLTTGTAQLTLDDSDSGAYSTSTTSGNTILSSFVNVSTAWLDSYGTSRNSYSLQTYIHEIGHALGLGHAGNYNGSATYGVDNHYANDSWQATIMSYFSQTDNTYVEASYAYIITPMIADILAMRDLYGTTAIAAGNTTYNFQSDFGNAVARTIVDTGGIDTLDFSWVSAAQRIDLNPETYSNTGGLIGNLGIARGTIIENVRGGSGNDVLLGNSAANTLTGNGGNDTLDGRGGADTLNGGLGNDTYVLAAENDTVIDSGGVDRITSTITRSLAGYSTIENLTLLGSGNINGTGNALANTIIGNAGNNILDGGAGADTLNGGAGNDTYVLGAENDTVIDSGGTDTITSTITRSLASYSTIENLRLLGTGNINGTGNALNNVLIGNGGRNRLDGGNGNDTLDGGAGVDTLVGGAGNDTYVLGAESDTVSDNGGIDRITSTITRSLAGYSTIENLTLLGSGNINGTGNALANTIIGNAGNNILDGGAGADTLNGGAGNDTYVLGAENDTVIDSGGTDTITSTITRSLASYSTIENLRLLGTGNINGTGNALNNVLIGNSGRNRLDGGNGNDTLDGGAGVDTLVGGAGNDTYVLGAESDTVSDNGGIDRITSTITRSLAGYSTIENLTLLGTGNINGTGNGLNNALAGNSGHNRLDGGNGNDTLNGGAGNDVLLGGGRCRQALRQYRQ